MTKGADLTEQKADSAYLIPEQGHAGSYEVHSDEKPHSLVARLIATGQITPKAAATHPQRSVIYRSIGVGRN